MNLIIRIRSKMAGNPVPNLVHALSRQYVDGQDCDTSRLLQHCLSILGSQVSATVVADEFRLSERIKKKLLQQNREQDALAFSDMFRVLQSKPFLKNKWALLYFLFVVSTERGSSRGAGSQMSFLYGSLSADLPSFPAPPSSTQRPTVIGARKTTESISMLSRQPVGMESSVSTHNVTGTSGIGSMGTSALSGGSFAQSSRYGPPSTPGNVTDGPVAPPLTRPREAWATASPTRGGAEDAASHEGGERGGPFGEERLRVGVEEVNPLLRPYDTVENTSYEVSEALIVRDLIYTFQGIDGKYIHYNKDEDSFRVDPELGVPRSAREICHKLAELGWLFRKVRAFIDGKKMEKTAGLVVQSFCAALSQELAEYYRLIAVLEAQQPLSEGVRGDLSTSLTLHRLIVWTHDPLQRMKLLAVLVDKSKGLKGGTLLSMLYSFSHHGDPTVRLLVKQLLTHACRPVNMILCKWLFEGQLSDTFHEFFISSDVNAPAEKLWHSKYSIRKSMVPSFITMETARKVLIAGKSINFLRLRCQDRTPIGEATARNWTSGDGGDDSTFDRMTGPGLQQVVTAMYQETSKHLLEVLNTKYLFLDHLKGLRRYLLLGQGDFIQHLMDLLVPELAKPAEMLFLHNLTGTLEAAIRATNAQFDHTDLLQRLDVRLLDISPGDYGWDVFSLDYHVDGPISTVFTPETMLQYLRVFNFLWRAKRMEFTLARLWSNQKADFKSLQSIKELRPVIHQCHTLCAAMVHFINQLQYYITFEVLECGWAILQKDVSAASDLDQIIEAHAQFLADITTRCLLDLGSQELLTQLRAVFDLIVELQLKQETIISQCLQELERRNMYERMKRGRTEKGDWGSTQKESEEEQAKRDHFARVKVAAFKSQMAVLQTSYESMVVELLSKVVHLPDENLRFLGMRLNFNHHYTTVSSDS